MAIKMKIIAVIISLILSITSVHAGNWENGRKLFRLYCMSCHGNIGQGGQVCPPNANSSLELLKFKVLEGKYPDGYSPKRMTHFMPKFLFLRNNINDLHEFLREPK